MMAMMKRFFAWVDQNPDAAMPVLMPGTIMLIFFVLPPIIYYFSQWWKFWLS